MNRSPQSPRVSIDLLLYNEINGFINCTHSESQQGAFMSISHLKTKLHIPPISPEYVPRSRLMAILEDGLQRKLTLLSAPAGFGKTTLLAGWIHQQQISAGWLSIDEGENELSHFLSYIIAAIQSILHNVGGAASDVLAVRQQPSHREVLNALINDLSTVEDHFILVLDDYQLINSAKVHAALEYLLEHLPECLHVFINTRSDPPLPLSLLRGRSEMIELRAKQLRFNQQETAEFFHKFSGFRLSDFDANTLTRLTEGWITGIQLAAISIKDEVGVDTFLTDFSGSNRYVLDYLVEEVLERQTEPIQYFLYASSILKRMTGPLCDAIMVRENEQQTIPTLNPGDGDRILANLERQNLFIIPLDINRCWYRYHHLFADLLHQRLNTLHPELVPRLHHRAATWFKSKQMISEAIDHSLACGDFENAVEMIFTAAEDALMQSEFIKLHNWIEILPERILADHPQLQIYNLYTAIYSGLPANEAINQLEKIMALDSNGQVSGDILAIKSLIAAFQQDISSSTELADRALEILPEDRIFFRSTVLGYLGFAYLFDGDMIAAKKTLKESIKMSSLAGNLTTQILGLSHLAEIALLEARFDDAKNHARQMLELAQEGEDGLHPITGLAYIFLGIIQRAYGNLSEAIKMLNNGVELVQKFSPFAAIQGYINLAWIHQFGGDEDLADSAMETATRLALEFEQMKEGDRHVLHNQAKMLIARGEPLQALEKLGINREDLSFEIDRLFNICDPELFHQSNDLIQYIITAEAFFAIEKFNIAEHLFSCTLKTALDKGWRWVEMSIKVYQAEIHFQCGRVKESLEILEPVLKMAAKVQLLSDFVERGSRLSNMIQNALNRGIEPEFVAKILVQIGSKETVKSHLKTFRSDKDLSEPLSEREKTILQYLKSHLTTTEIAKELSISVHTVRTHVKNIYQKLGVNSRSEAVAWMNEVSSK